MAETRVRCINKQPRDNTHEGITHVGDGNVKWTRQQAVALIEGKVMNFYTYENGKRAEVGVVEGKNGKYLRTYADGQWNDNLLSLMECVG